MSKRHDAPRPRPVKLLDERKEPPQTQEEAWWEDDDLLENPQEILDLPDETEMTTAEDEDWADEPLLEDPDESWKSDPQLQEHSLDRDPSWKDPEFDDLDDDDDLLQEEEEDPGYDA